MELSLISSKAKDVASPSAAAHRSMAFRSCVELSEQTGAALHMRVNVERENERHKWPGGESVLFSFCPSALTSPRPKSFTKLFIQKKRNEGDAAARSH